MRPVTDEMLVAYLDGAVSPAEAETVQDALQADPQLRRQAELLAQTWDLLGAAGDPPVRPDLADRIVAAAERAMPGLRIRRAVVRLAAPLAAAAAITFAVWFAWPDRDEPATFHQELGITPELEEAIVRNLDLLKAIEQDAALLEEAEFFLELDRQLRIGNEGGEAAS